MMSRFRKLFSFTKREIDWAFQRAHCISRVGGIKLLQAPGLFSDSLPDVSGENQDPLAQIDQVSVSGPEKLGKILIIIPGRAGKAYRRNLLRRRIKAIFYEQRLFSKPVTSILIVSSSKALALTYEQIKDFLVSSFNKN